jgi:ABC-2 type transport system permease protein/lipopolysaccharide transport system permease protein
MASFDVAGQHARSSRLTVALNDLVGGLKHWELWSMLGWHDIRQRYRRSVVGPFWLTLSMGVMVAGLAYLYGGLFGQNSRDYIPYVATGMIIFSLISTLASEGAYVFIASSSLILQLRAPLSIYIYQTVWRNVLIFAHNITIFILLILLGRASLSWTFILAIPGLLLVLIFGIWLGLILGTLSARFRDVPPIVSSILQVAFFLTPIFWLPQAIPDRIWFIQLNPFFYLVEIVRSPLLGKVPSLTVWAVVIGMNIVAGVVAVSFFARYRERVAYWV